MTYGLTELFVKTSENPSVSGWGAELTMRVALDGSDGAAALVCVSSKPSWAIDLPALDAVRARRTHRDPRSSGRGPAGTLFGSMTRTCWHLRQSQRCVLVHRDGWYLNPHAPADASRYDHPGTTRCRPIAESAAGLLRFRPHLVGGSRTTSIRHPAIWDSFQQGSSPRGSGALLMVGIGALLRHLSAAPAAADCAEEDTGQGRRSSRDRAPSRLRPGSR